MQFDVFTDCTQFQALVDIAREQLETIRIHPSPEPAAGSPAQLAFDPFIARHLNTFVPMRVLAVLTPEQTWKAIDVLLDGWHELSLLSVTNDISTWEVKLTVELCGFILMHYLQRLLETFDFGFPNRRKGFHIYDHLPK